MYRIGEFSKITSLSIKTLRYYHEQEIIVPIEIDEDTGYRIYSQKQLELADIVKTLRDMDFSIKEVKEVIDSCDDIDDITYYMEEKLEQIESKIKNLKKIQKNMNYYIQNRDNLKKLNDYTVVRKSVAALKVISIRYKGSYSDMSSQVGVLYKTAKQAVDGKLFNIYYDLEYREDDADIEVCLPVKREVLSKQTEYRILEAAEVLSVSHVGPYESIGDAYKFIIDYVIKNKIKVKDPSRVIYHKGPGLVFKGNPHKYITEIQILLD